jgi:EAL domain-containing protein (putative c-di-GMP-specific phosphodiesterase class I)
VLKIDMGLTREIEQNHRSRAIVASVVGMAASLGMGVVTEGVETEEQLDLLVGMGCRQFQGYYFSRPITVEEFEARVLG